MDTDFSHMHIEFYADAVENPAKSKAEGRKIYDEVEMCKILLAGDTKSVFIAPAHDQSSSFDPATNERLTYAELHSGPYEAFQKKRAYIGSGTLLKDAPFLSPSKIKELEGQNVLTIDALASLDGTLLQRLGPGARSLKDQAQAFLDDAASGADANALREENKALAERLAELEAQIAGASTGEHVQAVPETSPFADWDEESIRLWIEENGGSAPRKDCKLDTVIRAADKLNARLEEEKAA